MSDSILAKRLARLRSAYLSSGLYRFLSWWGDELVGLIPRRWLGLFAEQRDEVRLGKADGRWQLERRRQGQIADSLDLPLDAEPASLAEALRGFVAKAEGKADLVYLLPKAQLLTRRIVLPLAAEENLQQVLTFELDRQTPFKSDQVWMDHRTLKRDSVAKQLAIEVLMAPKSLGEAALAAIQGADLRFAALDGAAADGRRLGFNLLPNDQRARQPQGEKWLNIGLAGVCLVLLWAVMTTSLANREAALVDLQNTVDEVRKKAQVTDRLRDELEDAVEGANFLDTRKRATPMAIDILRDVTTRLPDDTALTRFQITRGEVQIQGQSGNAAALIPILQKSDVVEAPAIQGAITPSTQNQKDMFLIQAKAKLSAEAAAAEAKARDDKDKKRKRGRAGGDDANSA